MYNVYDCYGEIINSIRFSDGEAMQPIGLFKKHEVEQFIYDEAWKRAYEESENRIYFQGGYYTWTEWEDSPEVEEIFRIVTDKGDTIIMNKENDEFASAACDVIAFPDATGLCIVEVFGNSNKMQLQYVKINHDGTVLENLHMTDLPYTSIQIVGDKYVLVDGDLMDFSGKVIMEDTSPIVTSIIGRPYGGVYAKGEYFVRNGETYDSGLEPVPDETRAPDGDLITGVRYYVDGIVCRIDPTTLDWWALSYQDRFDYATGTNGTSIIAIKSIWGDCVIRDVDVNSVSVADVSSSMVLLSDFSLYSLKTGAFIRNANIEGFTGAAEYPLTEQLGYRLTDRYLIVTYMQMQNWWYRTLYEDFYVFDERGNLRYYSSKNQVGTARDDLILLKRGPYIGIADLNGEWVLKTIDPRVKRDAEDLRKITSGIW